MNTADAHHPCEPVGLIDIAPRLGVQDTTPQQWHHRKVLPPADWEVSGRAAWCWPHTIQPWAEATGRFNTKGPGYAANS